MTELREDVRIMTIGGKLDGYLFVGADELPELRVLTGDYTQTGNYRPSTFPAAWIIYPIHGELVGVLLSAWLHIDNMRREIIEAQREAEQETPEPEGGGVDA